MIRQFYKYIIYQLYTWAKNGPSNNTPIFNVIATLTFVHYTQLMVLGLLVLEVLPFHIDLPSNIALCGGVSLLLLLIVHYFLFYDKKRWASYEKEFKDEGAEASFIGKIYVLAYLIGSTLGSIPLMWLIAKIFH